MAEGLGISRLRFQGSETTAASSSTRHRLALIRKGPAFFEGKDSGLAPRKDVLAGAAVLLRRLIERTKALGHGIWDSDTLNACEYALIQFTTAPISHYTEMPIPLDSSLHDYTVPQRVKSCLKEQAHCIAQRPYVCLGSIGVVERLKGFMIWAWIGGLSSDRRTFHDPAVKGCVC